MQELKKVFVGKKGENSIRGGHPWVYDNVIDKFDDIKDGEIVNVFSLKNKYLGSGFYNSNSKIRVRLISTNTNDKFDYDFFKRRVDYAIDYRLRVLDEFNSFRVIFGESDEFPGLTVDKYNDILVSEVLSLGIDERKDMIYKALLESMQERGFKIKGIYERCDNKLRDKEGLDRHVGWYEGSFDTSTIIEENGLKYYVDFENGQKTGFFLDQKYNRRLIGKLAKDLNVLDVCTHTGSFGMNAKINGAKRVVSLDVSKKAIDDAKKNASLNNLDIEYVVSDAFEYLENVKPGEFDLIILDPPAFTKSRKTINQALSGYEKLNYLGIKALKRGGILASASCSHFASRDDFLNSIYKASLKAGKRLKLISETGPSPDHPELIGVKETKYLKFFIFEII